MGRWGDEETEGRRDREMEKWGNSEEFDMFEEFAWRFSPFFKGRCLKDRGVQKKVPKELLTPKL